MAELKLVGGLLCVDFCRIELAQTISLYPAASHQKGALTTTGIIASAAAFVETVVDIGSGVKVTAIRVTAYRAASVAAESSVAGAATYTTLAIMLQPRSTSGACPVRVVSNQTVERYGCQNIRKGRQLCNSGYQFLNTLNWMEPASESGACIAATTTTCDLSPFFAAPCN